MQKKNSNIKKRERTTIFKFIILQTLFIAKTVYGINDIKINEKYMQGLNKLTMKDFNDIFDKNENEYKNNLILINVKKESEFYFKT